MNDIMLRIVRNESLTDHEQTMYNTILNCCTDSPTIDGLFVLIQAINQKATQRGFKLKIDLGRKPPPKPKRRAKIWLLPLGELMKGASNHKPDPSIPGRLMWPIERELWESASSNSALQEQAFGFYLEAREELQRRDGIDPDDIDIMSEAIEAAAALGL